MWAHLSCAKSPRTTTANAGSASAARTVHYQNPLIVVGCVPERDGKVLLCKRSIEPRYGYWTLPAGFMELGETLAGGAARETLEEACATVELGPVVRLGGRHRRRPGSLLLQRQARQRLRGRDRRASTCSYSRSRTSPGTTSHSEVSNLPCASILRTAAKTAVSISTSCGASGKTSGILR